MQRSLRSQFAIVQQEPTLFHRSFAENIRYAPALRQYGSDRARLANAQDFATEGLPHMKHHIPRYSCSRGWMDNGEPRCIAFEGLCVDDPGRRARIWASRAWASMSLSLALAIRA